MILYKYVGYEAGDKIIGGNSIGFRQPCHFNDPMELGAAYPAVTDPLMLAIGDPITFSKKNLLFTKYAVLSLTRAPNNPLMWAHYADSHRGFVIGFDVSDDLFTNPGVNVIPVQYGGVIYTNRMPTNKFLRRPSKPFSVGDQMEYHPEHFEKLQRTFLHKAMCWSYEEEVRIVRNVRRTTWSQEIEVDGASLYLLELPAQAVKVVCIGLKNKMVDDQSAMKQFIAKHRLAEKGISVKYSTLAKDRWDIDVHDLPRDWQP